MLEAVENFIINVIRDVKKAVGRAESDDLYCHDCRYYNWVITDRGVKKYKCCELGLTPPQNDCVLYEEDDINVHGS